MLVGVEGHQRGKANEDGMANDCSTVNCTGRAAHHTKPSDAKHNRSPTDCPPHRDCQTLETSADRAVDVIRAPPRCRRTLPPRAAVMKGKH